MNKKLIITITIVILILIIGGTVFIVLDADTKKDNLINNINDLETEEVHNSKNFSIDNYIGLWNISNKIKFLDISKNKDDFIVKDYLSMFSAVQNQKNNTITFDDGKIYNLSNFLNSKFINDNDNSYRKITKNNGKYIFEDFDGVDTKKTNIDKILVKNGQDNIIFIHFLQLDNSQLLTLKNNILLFDKKEIKFENNTNIIFNNNKYLKSEFSEYN